MIALYSVPGVLWIPLILKLQSPLDLMVQSGRARKIASNLRAARLKHFNKPSIFILNKIQLINWKKKNMPDFSLFFVTIMPNFSACRLYDYRFKAWTG